MKRLLCIALLFLMISCGGNKSDQPAASEQPAAETTTEPVAGDAIKEGEKLVNESDCKTCHHSTNKIIGPAHADVAKKYEFTEANVKLLADRIIKGGSGVYGDIPMTPHPDLKPEDAEKMARYVLSLDGETEK